MARMVTLNNCNMNNFTTSVDLRMVLYNIKCDDDDDDEDDDDYYYWHYLHHSRPEKQAA